MTAKGLTLTRLIIDSVWSLATGWRLPGFNFNFATFMLGIIIVGVMLAMFGDFLVHFGVKPFDSSTSESMEGRIKRQNDAYQAQEKAWWDYYDSKYGG